MDSVVLWNRLRWPLLIFGVVVSVAQATRLYVLSVDYVAIIDATLNLIAGRGITNVGAAALDLSHVVRYPLLLWPFGYYHLLGAAIRVFGDPVAGVLALNAASIIVVFGSLFGITEMLRAEVGEGACLVAWIIWAVIEPPFLLYWVHHSSDLAAMAVFFAALATVLHFTARARTRLQIIPGILFGLLPGLRYAYWPVALVPVLALFVVGFCERDRLLLRGAQSMLVGAMLGIGAVFALLKLNDLQPTNMTDPKSVSLAWGNLLAIYPFPAQAVGFYPAWQSLFWELGLARFCEERGVFFIRFFHGAAYAVSAFVFAIYAISSIDAFRRDDGPPASRRLSPLFTAIGALVIVSTTGLLAALSLNPGRIMAAANRYIDVDRYYLATFPFITWGVSAWLSRHARGRGIAAGVVRGALVAVLAFGALSFARRCAFAAGAPSNFPGTRIITDYNPVTRPFARVLMACRREGVPMVYAENPIRVGAEVRHHTHLRIGAARLVGVIPMFLRRPPVDTLVPVRLFVGFPASSQTEDAELRRWVEAEGGKLRGRIEGFDLMEVLVRPSKKGGS